MVQDSDAYSKSFSEYAKKRFWRIYPELWLAVAVEIVVLLLLYHEPINYPQLGLFTFGQATIFQFWTPDFLRGYGCGCPNGALWTISILIQFYFCAYFIYKWLKGRQSWIWWVVVLISVIIGWVTPYLQSFLPDTVSKLCGVSLIPYSWMFMMAGFASEKKEKVIPFLKRYWWIIIALLILKRYVLHWDVLISSYALFDTTMLFAGIVGFAYAVPQVNIKTDISYGIYIYHMTVVNALIAIGFTGQSWTLWSVIGVTCILAWISTVTIGRFSIRMKESKV